MLSPGSVKDKLKEKPKQKDFLRIKLKKKRKKKKAKSGKLSGAAVLPHAAALHVHPLCHIGTCSLANRTFFNALMWWLCYCVLESVISVDGLVSFYYDDISLVFSPCSLMTN